MKSQNEYHYKAKLKTAIDKWLNEISSVDNDLGYFPEETTDNMVEAAWLIVAHNKNLNDFFEKEKMLNL
jgi:hypothetical protein